MPSVTIRDVRRIDGKIYVRFGKNEYEFNDVQHMRECVWQQLDSTDLQLIAMAMMLARQPALANPATFTGRTLTIDLKSNNWGTVS